ERHANRPPFAYLPFSGGPRQCIGKPLATMETHLVLQLLLQRWEIRVDPSVPVEPEALVTLRPRNGLHVSVEPAASGS
ncbi:MAG TPA: cytochrome P450, partial [Longimicrobiales bacterium]|nr:cytochrome P450 [Longimicrobiales bacterium]